MSKAKATSSGKPKGKTPSLIGSKNGRPKRVDVKAKSHCNRCEAEILKGEAAVEIPQLGKAYNYSIRVCNGCYSNILDQTEKDLQELRAL